MTSKLSILLCFILADFGFAFNGCTHGEVGFYEVKLGNFSAKFTNWGASLVSLFVPDRYGNFADVVLGFDSVNDYVNSFAYFGAIVGRVANRISGGQFVFEGKHYILQPNENSSVLHGGKKGFSRVVWKVMDHCSDSITFFYHSFDGEEGFPGGLNVKVTYALSAPYVLNVKMRGTSVNKITPVNLALHTYWNLGGHNSSSNYLSDEVQIFASTYTPTTVAHIPTGKILSVNGTPYDFREPDTIGSKITELTLLNLGGYDTNYVLDKGNGTMKRAARLYNVKSGRVLEVSTTESALQFYTANFLMDKIGKGGSIYHGRAALCLEPQGFPDSVNHPNFPQEFFKPGQTYKHDMVYSFSTTKSKSCNNY